MGIGLNSLFFGVLYLGSHYNTGPYISFPHFGNSNLGKLPCRVLVRKYVGVTRAGSHMWKCAIYQGFGTRNGLEQGLGCRARVIEKGLGFRV